MNPTQPTFPGEPLSRDLTEEMLEELAIMTLEAQEDDAEHHMERREAIEVAAIVQAWILEQEMRLPQKG
ncbi:MAG: hypothetical protein U0793_13170 [Gemmataceae bacterium]